MKERRRKKEGRKEEEQEVQLIINKQTNNANTVLHVLSVAGGVKRTKFWLCDGRIGNTC
jgi:hypothetical protein